MAMRRYFNTGDQELDHALNEGFASFVSHLEDTYGATIRSKTRLRSVFLEQLPSTLEESWQCETDDGMTLGEIYGEEIFDCARFPKEVRDGCRYDSD